MERTHYCGELTEADAAGHALAAGLRVAEVQKVHRKIHRAQSRRAGGDAPLHVAVEIVHHRLGTAGAFYVKSAQEGSSFRPRSVNVCPPTA